MTVAQESAAPEAGGFDARTLRWNLMVGAVVPAGAAGIVAANLVVVGLRSVADLGAAGGAFFAVAWLLAAACVVVACRCVGRVRRVSYRLVVAARAVKYAADDEDARALRKAADEFADCLSGARTAAGRIFPRQRVARVLERLEEEAADGSARLSEETLGQVRFVHDAARRWQDPVA